jgi:Zn-dependent peptidase ImmA (M78 family)
MSHIEDISVQYHENGVPILSKEQIEAIALNCISNLADSITLSPQMIPVKPLLDHLGETTGLTWQTMPLNFDTREMIFGICDIKNFCIYIEKELQENPHLLLFTLAHEIGHFILHRHRTIKITNHNKMFTDTQRQLKEINRLQSPADWLEWQANYFAASLLMPRLSFKNAVYTFIENASISLEETKSPDNFSQLLSYLHYMFGTSKTSVSIRYNEVFQESLVS